MSVLVKGMEMPKCCSKCGIEAYDSEDYKFYCPLVGNTDGVRNTSRHEECPLTQAKAPKPRESRAKLPCPKCGRKRLSVWLSCDKDRKPIEAIACDKCKIASAWSYTTIGAIRDWNKVVEEWTG